VLGALKLAVEVEGRRRQVRLLRLMLEVMVAMGSLHPLLAHQSQGLGVVPELEEQEQLAEQVGAGNLAQSTERQTLALEDLLGSLE